MFRPDSDHDAIAAVLELFEDDREAIDELVTAALGTLAECTAQIDAANDANDAAALVRAAHRLKGAAATIGGANVATIAAAIEGSGRAGACVTAATAHACRIAVVALDAELRGFLSAPLDAGRALAG